MCLWLETASSLPPFSSDSPFVTSPAWSTSLHSHSTHTQVKTFSTQSLPWPCGNQGVHTRGPCTTYLPQVTPEMESDHVTRVVSQHLLLKQTELPTTCPRGRIGVPYHHAIAFTQSVPAKNTITRIRVRWRIHSSAETQNRASLISPLPYGRSNAYLGLYPISTTFDWLHTTKTSEEQEPTRRNSVGSSRRITTHAFLSPFLLLDCFHSGNLGPPAQTFSWEVANYYFSSPILICRHKNHHSLILFHRCIFYITIAI